MKHTKHRRYGFLPSYRKSLSLDNCVAVLSILLFLGLVFHTLAPENFNPLKIRKNYPPSFNSNEFIQQERVYTKPACNLKNVASQNKCLIHQYSHKYGVNTEVALRIAKAESNFKADAVNYNTNGTRDLGIYQINDVHNVPDKCRLDARCNIEWAMQTMQSVGTTPWYSSKHNWYANR